MQKTEEELVGEHKLTVVSILTAVEHLTVKYTGEKKYAGLAMRELRGGEGTLLDRFAALMIEFEAEFKKIDPTKIEEKYRTMIDSIMTSWKKNGFSVQFNQDVQKLLFDEHAMPVYLTDSTDRAVLRSLAEVYVRQPT